MTSLSQRIAQLSPEKRELLLQRLNQTTVESAKILPQSRDTHTFPLSFAQQRLWFFNQLEPDSCAYNLPTALRLTGQLNIAALEKSINAIIQRHEILRTTFAVVNGEPVQVINAAPELQIQIIDLQPQAQAEQETEVVRLATIEAQRPFNLEKSPLLRVSLLRLRPTEHIVLLTMHHIVSDGWSIGILIREITSLYVAFSTNNSCTLSELPIQYADFAVWQRQYLPQVAEIQLHYWKQQLDGVPVLKLPTRARPPIQSDRGATQSFGLSQSLTQGLNKLVQQEGVTLFMTLLAAFKVLLHRYTQQDDIAVGTAIANRNRSQIESLIGFFVNTLVLRSDLGNNPTFRELLQRVREVTLSAYAHQDLPFEQLVEELQPERDLSHSSLFQVMFVLQNASTEIPSFPGLIVHPLKVESTTANFDLTLSMVETASGLKGSLEYNTDLFDPATITRMLEHFQTLLVGIVANPDQRLSALPILTAAEQQEILVKWNSNYLQLHSQCIHTLFAMQVEQTPDAVAVVFEKQQLTYRELNQQANQLANYLQTQGVKPEVVVGVYLERSLNLIIAVLAILKAGGAYLPLDPVYPQERVAYMLADAQVSVILTQAQLVTNLPAEHSRVVCIDADWEQIANQNRQNPTTNVTPKNLAYIIYTSGSTGKAKGVAIAHHNLVNAYFAWEKAYQLQTTATSHLQMASFSFDVFAGDLVRALCSGGKLVLCPRELLLEPEKLYQLMLREKIDCAEFVPGVLRNLIQYLEQTQQHLDSLHLLVCGSDSWYVQEYKKIRKFCSSHTRLINSFGLTETTIDSSYFEPATIDLASEQLVPIGCPFANTQIYILDRYLQPLPIGVTGEIYIGGAGLARGYLHQPELTALKFIPNLYSKKPGELLYKTGDLGRYLSDGNIELIGRSDHQVKLRGFRIELGEIAAAIAQHPAVKETVILVHENTSQYLVAYVVLTVKNLQASELQQFLQQRLPSYMIPTKIVILESLPLTPNGKINRQALAKQELNESTIKSTAPRDRLEKTLADIWAEILGIEIGIYDNFFECGGHSLLTTKLLLKIREIFQLDLPLRVLFESPTVASQAERLKNILQANTANHRQQNTFDLNAEVVLDPTICINITEYKPQTTNIFLTGATGFLGAFLLYELLQQTPADIYCLIRAANLEQASKKIQKTLEAYLIWNDNFSSRIIPVIGDLSQPLLGISETEFQVLADKIDVVYHNGAWVNHIYPYNILKSTNVLGTQEVIRLAGIKNKPVHFISTASIFSNLEIVTEADNIDALQVPDNGYVQTKWVSESLLKIAEQKGLPINIYRIGRISGHSKTGVFNINDFIYKLIISCIQLKSAPEGDINEDIMPIDYISPAIIHLSTQLIGKTFHLVNSQLLHSEMLLKVIRSFGYTISQIPYDKWRSQLIDIANTSPQHPLYPLLPFFPAKNLHQTPSKTAVQFDTQNTTTGLANTSIICPPINENLLTTYIAHLVTNKFIDPP